VVLVLAWGAFLRVSGVAWDGWRLQHPDERFVMMVAAQLELPRSPAELLDPLRSPANPNNRGFEFYVYGALPPTLFRAAGAVLGTGLERLVAIARTLTVLCDLVAIVLVMALAARLGGPRAGLLAGALHASAPLLLQQARFATVDVWGTTLVLAAAWAVVGVRPDARRATAAGVAVGLAAACKPNLALAATIPVAAVAAWWWEVRREGWRRVAGAVTLAGLVGVAAVLALKLADPGAFAAWWSPLPSPRRLAALHQLAGFLEGRGQYPPNLQWADRRAVLDPLANLLLWGTGPLLGAAAAIGLARVVRRAALGERRWWPVLAWSLPAVAWPLSSFVASVRHLEPFLPFAVVAAAAWLSRKRPWLGAAVVAGTALVGLAWAAVAWRPHTRVEASRWLVANLPEGAAVSAEYWDDALPLGGGGTLRTVTMRVFDPDTAAKRAHLLDVLEQVDAVVVSSQRGVGSICRVPDAYPITSEYYHLLFSGALGFAPAARFERRMGLGPLAVSDLSAEESLSVYDHPPVWVFVKTGDYSPELARRLLVRPAPGPEHWETRQLEARGSPPFATRWRGASTLPGAFSSPWWRQLLALLGWVVWVELAALAGQRLVARVLPRLPDGGWGAARWLGMVVAGLGWLWCGWIGVPGWNAWLPTLVLVAVLPWAGKAWRGVWRERGWRWAAVVFWGTFVLFLLVRAGNPEVYWGEKPMDAAIMAEVWRTGSFPPGDPWFAGSRLDYYFFGYLPYALPARALAIGPGVVFNLAAATVPALAAAAAAGIGWLLSGRLAGGLLAAVLAQLTGTAGVLFRPQLLTAGDFSVFWATSRVIADTINEYPVWTALFADLHAHYFGLPGFLVGLLVASAIALDRGRRGAAALAGSVVAVEAMTNTWEVPVLVAALILGCFSGGVAGGFRKAVVRRTSWLAVVAGTALAVSLPYWWSVRGAVATATWSRGPTPPAVAYLELFGVPGALVAVALVLTLVRGGDRAVAWAWLLVGAGLALVVAPEVLTVSDRMNTVFKFHLQAHLALASGLAGVLAALVPRLSPGWRRLALAAVAVPLGVGLLTAAGCAATVLATRRVAGPRPTLDGNGYLAASFPERATALARLAAVTPAGPVLETPGTPYTDTLRVPMFTGHASVVGWEYHLWQRRRSWAEIRVRQADLEELLVGVRAPLVEAMARRYRLLGAVSWTGGVPAAGRLPGWEELTAAGDVRVVLAGRSE